MARSLREKRELLERYEDSRRIFLREGGFTAKATWLRQPQLAATLARLQRYGPRESTKARRRASSPPICSGNNG
jgi:gamma-glutamyltranspeptidase/glutathione hydrolase